MEMQPKNPTAKGASDWFSGDVFVDPIAHVEDQRTSRSAINRIRAEEPGSALRGSWG